MPLRELHEALGGVDGANRLRLPERLERDSAGETVRVAGRHVVLIENAGDLLQIAQLRCAVPITRNECDERVTNHGALTEAVGDRLDGLFRRLLSMRCAGLDGTQDAGPLHAKEAS